LPFLSRVGKEAEFAADFFLKAGLFSASAPLSITSLRLSFEGRVFFVVIDDTVTARDLDPPVATGVCTPSLFGSAALESTCGFSVNLGAIGAGSFGSLWGTPVGDEDEEVEDSLMGPWPDPKNENSVFCFALGVSLGFPMVREKKNAGPRCFQTPKGRVASQKSSKY